MSDTQSQEPKGAVQSVVQADRPKPVLSEKYADETLRLVEEYGDQVGPLTPEKESKLRFKLYLYMMGLISAINLLLFVRPCNDVPEWRRGAHMFPD
jgi:hypothetical protein